MAEFGFYSYDQMRRENRAPAGANGSNLSPHRSSRSEPVELPQLPIHRLQPMFPNVATGLARAARALGAAVGRAAV
jgi:hypothetical protein